MAKNKKRRRQRRQRFQTKKSTPTSTHSPWRLIGISILIAVGLIVFVSVFGEGGYDSAHLAQIKPKPPIIWTANAWRVLADSWGYRASKFMRLQLPVGNIAGILVILGFAVLIANKLSRRLHRAVATVAVIMVASGAYMSVGANCAGGSGASANITPTPQPGVVYFLDDHLGNTHLVTDSVGNVVYEESRYPYGVKKYDRNMADNSDAVSESKPYYSYTGKEYDEETGLIYFGGRYYAPELGRWITPDPLFLEKESQTTIDSPIEANLYSFSRNNPLRFIDPDGFKPGDLFSTAEEAATDAIHYINLRSIRENLEYGGWIRKKWGGKFTYKEPTQGTADRIPNFPIQPRSAAAWYHTHANADPLHYKSEEFSQADKKSSDNVQKAAYLGTPSSAIKLYDPKTKSVSILERGTDHVEHSNARISTIPYSTYNYSTTYPNNDPLEGTKTN